MDEGRKRVLGIMAAILAKKLGMTQRFLDDGRVERVTVLEAQAGSNWPEAAPEIRSFAERLRVQVG